MKTKEPKLNWKLPLSGAVGFGVGFIIGNNIAESIIYSVPTSWNVIVYAFWSVIVGAIMGTIGGASLGFALKEKKKTLYLSCAGAIGFAIGYAIFSAGLYIALNPLRGADAYIFLSALMGIIGGASLGLATKNKKNALYLSCAGAIGFAIGGGIGHNMGYTIICIIGDCGRYNMITTGGYFAWGAIGGAALGLALAYLIKEEDKSINPQ